MAIADEGHQAAESIANGRNGRPGTTPSTNMQERRDEERVRIIGELADHRLVGRTARAALGDQQAGGERDDQRGNLRDEAVADRKLGEDVGGRRKRQAVAGDADDDAAENVDARG